MNTRVSNKAFSKGKFSIAKVSVLNNLHKPKREFIISVLWLFLSIKGRINFLQLARFGEKGEQHYRRQFSDRFDFAGFNAELIRNCASKHLVLALDPTHLPKSGKKTYGKDFFWSGCAGAVKPGLEFNGLAAVDIENHTALHLEAQQSPTHEYLKKHGITQFEWYLSLVGQVVRKHPGLSRYLCADAFFSRCPFVAGLEKLGIHLISRLRDDTVLFYPFQGEPTGKRGRPTKYAGKVNLDTMDLNHFSLVQETESCRVFSAKVWVKAFHRKVALVVCESKDSGKKLKRLYFSTDTELDPITILDYYAARFQIEFLYRDAKQHTGLNDCQARSRNKLNFHVNASLTAVNIAKAEHWLTLPKQERGPFSMANIKTLYHNDLLLKRFFSVFGINPHTTKNQHKVKELLDIGKIAC